MLGITMLQHILRMSNSLISSPSPYLTSPKPCITNLHFKRIVHSLQTFDSNASKANMIVKGIVSNKNKSKVKLAFGRMLKPAVLNGAEKLRLEQEVSEPRAVDPHVPPVHTPRNPNRSDQTSQPRNLASKSSPAERTS